MWKAEAVSDRISIWQNVMLYRGDNYRRNIVKRELGIARCGLACCLCSENIICQGCNSGQCPDVEWCENRKCSIEKGQTHCYRCSEKCRKFIIKNKAVWFTLFAKRYGEKNVVRLFRAQ